MERITLTLSKQESEVMKILKLADILVKAGQIKELTPRGINTYIMLKQLPPMPQLIAIPINDNRLLDDVNSILILSNDDKITKEIIVVYE